MKRLLHDIRDELKQFLTGKTIDSLIPPVVYIIANSFFSLKTAIFVSIGVAILLAIFRIYKKQSILYALGGIAGVALAGGFALLSSNAADYFIPRIVGSGASFLAALISVVIGRPLAAIVSHVARGWPFPWFMRKDIKPAYREVTLVWALLFLGRGALQLLLYNRGNLTELGWASLLLGFPATLTVLIASLVYGIWRLKRLGGPGIDEFKEGKNPPWEGQRKGF